MGSFCPAMGNTTCCGQGREQELVMPPKDAQKTPDGFDNLPDTASTDKMGSKAPAVAAVAVQQAGSGEQGSYVVVIERIAESGRWAEVAWRLSPDADAEQVLQDKHGAKLGVVYEGVVIPGKEGAPAGSLKMTLPEGTEPPMKTNYLPDGSEATAAMPTYRGTAAQQQPTFLYLPLQIGDKCILQPTLPLKTFKVVAHSTWYTAPDSSAEIQPEKNFCIATTPVVKVGSAWQGKIVSGDAEYLCVTMANGPELFLPVTAPPPASVVRNTNRERKRLLSPVHPAMVLVSNRYDRDVTPECSARIRSVDNEQAIERAVVHQDKKNKGGGCCR